MVAGFIIALESIGWTIMAVITSGVRQGTEKKMIRLGACFIGFSMLGLIYAMPGGPIYLIALFSFIMGMGFGMSWAFVSKRIISNVPDE